MLRPILKFGDRVLQQPAEPVDTITPQIQELIDDMIETMHAAPGVGLAAPQVGVALRLFVVDVTVGREPAALHVCINPSFVAREGLQLEEEGCLSLPGFTATVLRPVRAVIQALDRTGRSRAIEGTGLLARALQHEMDHLDGTLFVDRLRGLMRNDILGRVRRLQQAGQW